MAKNVNKESENTEVTQVETKINSLTVDIIDKQVRNFLISTKNQEQKVDNIIEAVDTFRNEFRIKLNEIFVSENLKEGDKIPEDKVEVLDQKYRDLLVQTFEVDKTGFEQYTEEEFDKVSEGLVLPYQDLKILKYWLIKK